MSALRRILCGRIKDSVDLRCSTKREPSMQEVLATVRKYSNLQRIDLTFRKRNDMQVDGVTDGTKRDTTSTGQNAKAWTYQGKGPSHWGNSYWSSPTYTWTNPANQAQVSDDWGGTTQRRHWGDN